MISICLSVPKDLANSNHKTDLVLLYNVASHVSREGLKLFWGQVPPISQNKSLVEKTTSKFFYFDSQPPIQVTASPYNKVKGSLSVCLNLLPFARKKIVFSVVDIGGPVLLPG